MLIVSWSLVGGTFRLSVEDRGSRVQALPVAATSGTTGAGSHPAFTGRVQAPAGSDWVQKEVTCRPGRLASTAATAWS